MKSNDEIPIIDIIKILIIAHSIKPLPNLSPTHSLVLLKHIVFKTSHGECSFNGTVIGQDLFFEEIFGYFLFTDCLSKQIELC